VCLFFFNTDKKIRCDFYKKRRPCVLSNISIVAISVGLPVAVNNPVPANQVRFQQFRAIQRFCVEGSNKHSDCGHSSNDLQFVTDRTFRVSFSDFCELINAFHFFFVTMGEGGLTSGLAYGLASVKSGPQSKQQTLLFIVCRCCAGLGLGQVFPNFLWPCTPSAFR